LHILIVIGVQVFSHAKVHFSIGGHQFVGEPVFFSYMPDVIMEHARNVTIKLHNRVGRYLRLQLYFAAKWIMVSEVSFDSGEFRQILNTECFKKGFTSLEAHINVLRGHV
jgi:hypothetical protein